MQGLRLFALSLAQAVAVAVTVRPTERRLSPLSPVAAVACCLSPLGDAAPGDSCSSSTTVRLASKRGPSFAKKKRPAGAGACGFGLAKHVSRGARPMELQLLG